MEKKIFKQSGLPLRRTVDLLPEIFKTPSNDKFLSATLDALVQPGTVDRLSGYVGRKFSKTYSVKDTYLDVSESLRNAYQLEPGVIIKNQTGKTSKFYDYIDFKNQLKYFRNNLERDDLITGQSHYSWNPPIDWDKFSNYREYYWLPLGPENVKVAGQAQEIISSYRVRSDGENEWLFIPDGLKRNPQLTLYRGQTYEFNVNSPGDPFFIRTDNLQGQSTNYNKGVTNNGSEVGKIIFVVPNDAPDVLYYQSGNNLNRVGRFNVASISDATFLDVEKEILGKEKYISSNGVIFTNGLKIEFVGKVIPEIYSHDSWVIEGVGSGIKLVRFSSLELPPISNPNVEVFFDDGGFDGIPFDDAKSFPTSKDYVTINRASRDLNPWSRYNRWFHRSVIEYSAEINNSSPSISEDTRAKRPIIEFIPNIQLVNHASVTTKSIDLIDDFTKDVFSTIEGSAGYNVDNVNLFEGARVLFTADSDVFVKNKIFVVKFIRVQTSSNIVNKTQISLIEADDSDSLEGEGIVVRLGKTNAGLMYHYDGENWVKSQQKTAVNQPPKFDVFDEEGISFSDSIKYGTSSFTGSEIVSYKVGTGNADTELGFPLSYLNIDNSGDILFESDWDIEKFVSQIGTDLKEYNISSGYYKVYDIFTNEGNFYNGWIEIDEEFYQPIIQSITVESETDELTFSACEWNQSTREKILFFLNGEYLRNIFYTTETKIDRTFKFNRSFNPGDVVTIKIYTDAEPNKGFYEFPLGLERNPLNEKIIQFTLGQANDHLRSMVELTDSFSGDFPGNSNLRDLTNYQRFGRRFIKHSGISPIAFPLLCDKKINVIKSLRSASSEYEKFKTNFLSLALELPFDNDVVSFVDKIIDKINQTKSESSAFSNSDMIGSGAYREIRYTVEDTGIKTFALSERFDLTSPSTRAVYVYRNNNQLVHGIDYQFDITFGFVRLITDFNEGDELLIKEYFSTSFNFIPETPTKLGLYKKYTPKIYVDDTYQTPTTVIQGHDGSLTVTYNDFRDDLLLELELRIFNNIKIEYDEKIFDIDKIFGSYDTKAIFDKAALDSVIEQEFTRWAVTASLDVYGNSYYITDNPFTYTYNRALDITGQIKMPGFWRGIYKYLYDTDRPHTCPWEMLGFSIKPEWWEELYGPAPYTSGNLILWEDLRDGIIRDGRNVPPNPRYIRKNLLEYIPVDEEGNLLDPLSSFAIKDYSVNRTQSNFLFGDVSPVEAAWRRSSSYPFVIIIAASLMRPMEFLSINFDRNQIKLNKLHQIVSSNTSQFLTLDDILKFKSTGIRPNGIMSYVVNYLKLDNSDMSVLTDIFENFDVRLSNRLGGFVDKKQQKYILDSKNPKSKTSGVFVPFEDYDIFFNVSSPTKSISYSGVVVEKTENGFQLSGYDNIDTQFNYYRYFEKSDDPILSVGGVSENFVDWESNKFYNKGLLVRNQGRFFRTIITHNSTDIFVAENFIQLQSVPIVDAITAVKRTDFNKSEVLKLNYGSTFSSVQEVVDFFLGYEAWLKDQGLVFDDYNMDLQVSSDWETSSKEFMFWTSHNWANGSIISLSPSALKIKIIAIGDVADNILDSFYDYRIYQSDGTKLPKEDIQVYRGYNELLLTPKDLENGIYFANINFVQKEHVVVFNDKTIFNDVLFDKGPGYRQDRLKVVGFRTTDWDGDYTSPGFIFDNVKIEPWQAYVDYRLGDIVQYKQFNYVSKSFQKGVEEFDRSKWEKLDTRPEEGLLANFDYKINQIEDYYELDYQGINNEQKIMARHSIGYEPREYLQNLAEDEVSQFKLYQGFIREKGTANAIIKVFDKLSKIPEDAISLKEEWAVRLGSFGGTDQYNEVEFKIGKSEIKLNPQPVILNGTQVNRDQFQNYILLDDTRYDLGNKDYKFPIVEIDSESWTAGYVNPEDVDFFVNNLDEIFFQDIKRFNNGTTIWAAFLPEGWNVLRYNITNISVVAVAVIDTTTAVLETNLVHNLEPGEIIGLTNIKFMEGFWKIKSVSSTKIFLEIAGFDEDPEIDQSSFSFIGTLRSVRIADISKLTENYFSQLPLGSKVWVDKDENSRWTVLERRKQYSPIQISEYGISFPSKTGQAVGYIQNRNQVVVSNPGSTVEQRDPAIVVYFQGIDGLIPLQILNPDTNLVESLKGNYGEILEVSKDGRWMIAGSPRASFIPNNFRGQFNTNQTYIVGDTVTFGGKLWKAINNINPAISGDGSTIDLESQDWELVKLHTPNYLGRNILAINQGYSEQGSVDIFEYDNGQWNYRTTVISPNPQDGENFGESISIGKQEGIEGTSGDVTLTITEIDNVGGIISVSASGISGLDDNRYSNISGIDISESGTGATFDISKSLNQYIVTVRSNGRRYAINDRIKIPGYLLGGISPTNDLFVTVTNVTPEGSIIGSETYTNITGISSNPPSVEANFEIRKTRSTYTVIITSAGSGYTPRSVVRFGSRIYACIKDTKLDRGVWSSTITYQVGDIVKFPEVGSTYYRAIATVTGIVPTDPLYYQVVDNITPVNSPEFWTEVSGGIFPTIAVPYVEKDSRGNYIGYKSGSIIVIPGSQLGGQNSVNDLTIRINQVGPTGEIENISIAGIGSTGIIWTGIGSTGSAQYNDIVGEDISDPGSGAIFDIIRSGGEYSAVVNVKGIRYNVGDQIKIRGTELGAVEEAYYMAIGAPGSNNELGRTYIYKFDGIEWKILETEAFLGIFNVLKNYSKGSIVWYGGSYWKALIDHIGTGSSYPSTPSADSTAIWEEIDFVNVGTLPSTSSMTSTGLLENVLDEQALSEDLRTGDRYGTSLKFNDDASKLVISAPYSDSVDIENYKGLWKSYQIYLEGDVVRYQDKYYRLVEPGDDSPRFADSTLDTTVSSVGIVPTVGSGSSSFGIWQELTVDLIKNTGSVFVYTRDSNDVLRVKQTIDIDTVNSELPPGKELESGDQIGFRLLLNGSGSKLIISAPNADNKGSDQGSVLILDYVNDLYHIIQKIDSPVYDPSERFGSTIAISPDNVTLVISSENGESFRLSKFDAGDTTFDRYATRFRDPLGRTGKVYVYNEYSNKFVLSEVFEDGLKTNEDFGRSLAISNDSIVIGSPAFISDDPAFRGEVTGRVQLFRKDSGIKSWTKIRNQSPGIDTTDIKSLAVYNTINSAKIADVDVVDPYKGKILSIADQDIDIKTSYDPAIYNIGKENSTVNPDQAWLDNKVGTIWWNTSSAKWILYEQADLDFRVGNWGRLAEGASIDVYEWVSTIYLPSEWNEFSGSSQGFSLGISGTPLYPDNSTYSSKVIVDSITGQPIRTIYYYWVRNKTTLPNNSTKTNPTSVIANYIINPISAGVPFAAIIDSGAISFYNFQFISNVDELSVNIQFYKRDSRINLIHNEYQLISESSEEELNQDLENKWIDSLVGQDILNRPVPDIKLVSKSRYGIKSTPRQGMFINRDKAVEISLKYINDILKTKPFAEIIDYKNLSLTDPAPSEFKKLYDTVVETQAELRLLSTSNTKPAVLRANLINGHINTVDVLDTGYGYRKSPLVIIEGNGIGGKIELEIDRFGKVLSPVTVLDEGRKYTEIRLKVRPFSVLVRTDETIGGFWSIWSWDERLKVFYRTATQSFDTTKYWKKIDWWKKGFNSDSRITADIPGLYAEPEVDLKMGELLRVENYGSGGWAVLQRVDSQSADILGKYVIVGRKLGTIEILNRFYNTSVESAGYDQTQTFDSNRYDFSYAKEFRNILKALKDDIFVDELSNEWNKLFFVSVHYIFSEQLYVDWIFKTSFMNAIHNVGYLENRLTYKSDNLDSYQKYIEEVKPYRTKIRKYTSRYQNIDSSNLLTTDFDLPPVYDPDTDSLVPVKADSKFIDLYPWKSWFDNKGYSITDIVLISGGKTYTSVPKVIFEGGGGSGAVAQAYISNGRVTSIALISGGAGFTSAPSIKLVGGVGSAIENEAKAIAFIGDTKVRSFDLAIKFDRYSKTPKFKSTEEKELFKVNEVFEQTVEVRLRKSLSVFNLKYPPNLKKSTIEVLVDNVKLFNNEYKVETYSDIVNSQTVLKGRIILNVATTSRVNVSYQINDLELDSLNRIDKYYTPKEGMLGVEKIVIKNTESQQIIEVKRDYSQLITGIDFGGSIVQGATFDVGAGWDALPWSTEGWDSSEVVESDYYLAAIPGQTSYQLARIPDQNEQITIYLKRVSTGVTQRLDYPTYDEYQGDPSIPDVPPPTAVMNTFIGDGSTKTVILPSSLTLNEGDVLIFRTLDSDGSLQITNRNLIDTNISGGTLENNSRGRTTNRNTIDGIYKTATGRTAAEILVDGGKFISPDKVAAPEENIPGQVLEALSIKVFHTSRTGAPSVMNKIYRGTTIQNVFEIGQTILDGSSVIVFLEKTLQTQGVDYVVDYPINSIRFINKVPQNNEIVEVFSISIGGVEILDYKEFTGDSNTRYFLTSARYESTGNVYAYVNGVATPVGFVNSTGRVPQPDQTLVEFGTAPLTGRKISILVISNNSETLEDPIVKINSQVIELDSLDRSYTIESFIELDSSATGNVLVELNGKLINSVDTVYRVYDGQPLIPIGTDPKKAVGEIIQTLIKVYVNNKLINFGFDYLFSNNTIQILKGVSVGDIIRIEDYTNSFYTVSGNQIILADSLSFNTGDVLEITWFDRYDQIDIIKDIYTGGRVGYPLQRVIDSVSYVWVYKNGDRLTPDVDFYLDDTNDSVYLRNKTDNNDIIETVIFSTAVYRNPICYEIFKDVLNRNLFNRYSISDVVLTKQLNYFDTELEVNDSSLLPNPTKDQLGILTINGEKIQYLRKDLENPNKLLDIRRGMFGSSIGELYSVGTPVVNTSFGESLPYKESQEKEEFNSNGLPISESNPGQLIGPLTFIPLKTDVEDWYRDTIPNSHSRCDQIEVFVGGRRLRKDFAEFYDQSLGSYSPAADIKVEAEFSVDGSTPYIRLTNPAPAGSRVIVIKRIGRTWYTLGNDTAADGKGLFESNTTIAKFLQNSSTKLP